MQVLREGQKIKHEQYGMGVVTASDTERTSIDFEDHGPKLFVTSLMTAELIGEAELNVAQSARVAAGANGRQLDWGWLPLSAGAMPHRSGWFTATSGSV